MNLYRIILVDDEEEVRKGIIRKIDWNHLGSEMQRTEQRHWKRLNSWSRR